MFAAHGNHPHALNELLNHGGDLTLTNLNDDTALSIAIKRSSKEGTVITCLLRAASVLMDVLSLSSPECYRRLPVYAPSAIVSSYRTGITITPTMLIIHTT